ncbi:hypothetical protein HNR46_001700 [Haloferula luteola]|uniref:Transcription elongation factor GreAB n=1 Tax=Haloferula luteola TaxID=595692 RepID=A0A840V222_9BACT|nr:hypothetical protein [Haloferula luteola]MBB5351463.1 hypothetical protein [Haloferula luteola]
MPPKKQLIESILTELRQRFAQMESAAKDAHAAASDPDSKAESKYDTRSLEASYLAAGQAQQVAELAEAVTRFAAFEGREFELDESIDAGALVEISGEDTPSWYLLAPAAGGLSVTFDDIDITVLTPASRLYQSLLGKQLGDEIDDGFITEIR